MDPFDFHGMHGYPFQYLEHYLVYASICCLVTPAWFKRYSNKVFRSSALVHKSQDIFMRFWAGADRQGSRLASLVSIPSFVRWMSDVFRANM